MAGPYLLALTLLLLSTAENTAWSAEQSAEDAVASVGPPRKLPPVMLWAWEQPQDLRFLDPEQAGVAFLARTVRLHGSGVEIADRRQPLRLPEGAVLIAVVRIEAAPNVRLGDSIRAETLEAILRVAGLPGIAGIQIDFDARRSQRGFYADLLRELRSRVPDGCLLSMTALASWCMGDCWVEELPVDEIVPMFFRMGADDTHIRQELEGRDHARCRSCRTSAGVSTDEAPPRLPAIERLYLFHGGIWREADLRRMPGLGQ